MFLNIIIVILIVLIAVILLSVRILLVKNGSFHSEHISANKKMRENGIGCATSQDRQAQWDDSHKLNVKEL
ncbi:MAG: hypothetical protein IJ756_10215 [Paludibacteraceae bacterium]|nr:hypothetical protein [Paludibacteraceae bacterium]